MIRKGDQVKIKPEYQDEGDADILWFAVDDEDKGRVKVQAEVPNMVLKPQYVLNVTMIDKV